MPMREASAYDVLRASSLLIESGALQAAAASEVNNA